MIELDLDGLIEYRSLPADKKAKFLGQCSFCEWSAVAHGRESFLIDTTYSQYFDCDGLLVLLICVECRADRRRAIESGGHFAEFVTDHQMLCDFEEVTAQREH